MLGTNKISKIQNHTDNKLNIVKIFSTIQGEGIFTGHPAIFIRLGGCNLTCDFCDTEFDKYSSSTIESILEEIKNLSQNSKIKLIVITGGEPLLQPINNLCESLIELGYQIQIETNGTIKRKLPKEVNIICSPKNHSKKGYIIDQELIEFVTAFKFIISKTNPEYNRIPDINTNKPIYIQPMDELDQQKNKENIDFAVKLAKKTGYIISLQTHKIMEIE